MDKILLVIIIVMLSSAAFSQSTDELNSEFELGVNYFDSARFDQALTVFSKIIDDYDYNPKTTGAIFFKAKILLQEERYNAVKDLLNLFLERYPWSRYTNEIRMMFVQLYLEQNNYYDAFKETMFLVDRSGTDTYKSEAKKVAKRIAYNFLNSIQLQRLYNSFTEPEIRSFILLSLGKSHLKENEIFTAKSVFLELINKYPQSNEYEEANKLYETPYVVEDSQRLTSLIGVMLPLNENPAGEYTSAASIEILQGIKLAVSEFNKNRDKKIGLIIRDTKNDIGIIQDITDELIDNFAVKAVLGPIYSNEVRAALPGFSGTNLPVLSPTATDDDLAGLSDNFFQANPSFSKRGKIMAQYIYYVENRRKISVLNAIEGYSPLLAATFVEEFEKLGGQILRRESYKSKTYSFSDQISRIAVDSLILDGLYIPLAENIDAPAILSQLVQFNLNLPIFGNQDWFSAKGFETSTELSNQLTFSTDYFISFKDDNYQELNARFSALTGADINRNVLYGYDAAKYLLTVMRNIDNSRTNIRNKMISGISSSGFHNNISFDDDRVNKFLNIVRYKDGVFELVEKFRGSN